MLAALHGHRPGRDDTWLVDLRQVIDVNGKLAQQSSSSAISPYVKHRQADVRKAAALALIKTGGGEAVQALRDALRGNDPALRGVAASGLGSLKAHEAVADLFAVLPRGVAEAASSIGELCRGAECPKFVELIGKLPFDFCCFQIDTHYFWLADGERGR